MRVLERHNKGYVLGHSIFANPRRTLGYVLVLFVLAAIPFTYYLANQIQDIRQRAAGGETACLFTPGTIRPGETAELLIATYPYQISPHIEPKSGYIMTGQIRSNTLTYQFNTPNTTWTASLLDPANPLVDGKPNKIASCTISTSEK